MFGCVKSGHWIIASTLPNFWNRRNEAARNVLFCLSTLGRYGAELVDIEPPWQALHRYKAKKYNFATSLRDFRRAVDELEGSFIKIDNQCADFLNPSIRDFIENQFREGSEFFDDVLAGATRFKQIAMLWKLAAARPSNSL
jgi:hypothetical protein